MGHLHLSTKEERSGRSASLLLPTACAPLFRPSERTASIRIRFVFFSTATQFLVKVWQSPWMSGIFQGISMSRLRLPTVFEVPIFPKFAMRPSWKKVEVWWWGNIEEKSFKMSQFVKNVLIHCSNLLMEKWLLFSRLLQCSCSSSLRNLNCLEIRFSANSEWNKTITERPHPRAHSVGELFEWSCYQSQIRQSLVATSQPSSA